MIKISSGCKTFNIKSKKKVNEEDPLPKIGRRTSFFKLPQNPLQT